MAKIKIVDATQELIDDLKGRIREADVRECYAASGTAAADAMQKGFECSKFCLVALADDVPFIAFGVAAKAILGTKGTPWLLGTEAMRYREIRTEVKSKSKKVIEVMLQHFDSLENYVDNDNRVSIAWLKACGFKVEDPEIYGVGRELFRRFHLSKGDTNV